MQRAGPCSPRAMHAKPLPHCRSCLPSSVPAGESRAVHVHVQQAGGAQRAWPAAQCPADPTSQSLKSCPGMRVSVWTHSARARQYIASGPRRLKHACAGGRSIAHALQLAAGVGQTSIYSELHAQRGGAWQAPGRVPLAELDARAALGGGAAVAGACLDGLAARAAATGAQLWALPSAALAAAPGALLQRLRDEARCPRLPSQQAARAGHASLCVLLSPAGPVQGV